MVPVCDPQAMYFLECVATRNPHVVKSLATVKFSIKTLKRSVKQSKKSYQKIADEFYRHLLDVADEDSSPTEDVEEEQDPEPASKRQKQ